MCGIVGISAETNVAAEIYDSLLMLQHRGQDAAGMSVCDNDDKLKPENQWDMFVMFFNKDIWIN